MPQVNAISVKDAAGQTVDVATLTALIALIGEVEASPSADTLLDRVKALKTSIDNGNTARAETRGPHDMAASQSVVLATNHGSVPVNQVSSAYDVARSFARPADVLAYAAGDVVGGPLAFNAIGPSGQPIVLTGAQLEIDVAAIPSGMTGFKLYLYSVTPPSALADNAAFDLVAGDRASFLGVLDLGSPTDLGSTLYVETNTVAKQLKLASANLYGYLVTSTGYTPAASDAFKVTLHAQAV